MTQGQATINILSSSLPRWDFLATNVTRKYGLLIMGWNTKDIHIHFSWGLPPVLAILVRTYDLLSPLLCINTYGSYVEK
jgi:hypothetical protein